MLIDFINQSSAVNRKIKIKSRRSRRYAADSVASSGLNNAPHVLEMILKAAIIKLCRVNPILPSPTAPLPYSPSCRAFLIKTISPRSSTPPPPPPLPPSPSHEIRASQRPHCRKDCRAIFAGIRLSEIIRGVPCIRYRNV